MMAVEIRGRDRDRLTSAAFVVPAGLPAGDVDRAAWAAAVATVAGWPATEPRQPLLERRIGRAGRRGAVREVITASLTDPLGLGACVEAERELDELLRPLRRARALRPVALEQATRLLEASLPFTAELRELDPRIPEGAHALPLLFADLCAGLEALPGPVDLRLAVAPAPADLREAVDGEAPPSRQVRFSLRLGASMPVPAPLRARAEAICLARRSDAWTWSDGRDDDLHVRLVAPGLAAAVMALGGGAHGVPAAVFEGRPVEGAMPRSGAVLGRVRRSNGRAAGWRLGWEERRHHTFVAGASGCGKSTALLRLVRDDLAEGRTVVVIDPHGDLADEVLALAGSERVTRIDPRDPATVGIDLLDAVPARAASNLMSAVNEIWPADFAGPVWHRAISLTLRVLAALPDADQLTLASVERYLVDARWRTEVLERLPEGRLRAEGRHEAAAWSSRSGSDSSVVSWLAGKLTPLTQGPAASLFDRPPQAPLEQLLRRGRAIVVSLPIGELGTDTVKLIGRMLLTRVTTALTAQGAWPVAERNPVSIVIDEAHLLAGPAMSGLFAQARKYQGAVTLATQSPSQLGTELPSILTNAQTLLLGRLPFVEARVLCDRLGADTLAALPILPRHHLVVVTEDNSPVAPPLVLTPVPLS